MCVKTKTEWSCGCHKKALTTCDDAPDSRTPCDQIDRYRYLDDGDCKECKAGGANVTRGQDGLGRYGREIAAREKKTKRQTTRVVLGEIAGNASPTGPASDDRAIPIVTPDPWLKPTRREKEWESPNRRHADEEWEREHARRKEDIETLWESHSSSPKTKPRLRRAATAPQPLPFEVEDSLLSHHDRRGSGSLQSMVRQINLATEKSNRPRQNRYDSYESIESVPSRGRSRTTPVQYGYTTGFGYTVENRAPRDSYGSAYNPPPVVYGRR